MARPHFLKPVATHTFAGQRVVAAHVRHAVDRHLVLGRPAQLRLEAEALARPCARAARSARPRPPGRSCGSRRPPAASRRARGSSARATRVDRYMPLADRAPCGRPRRTSARGGSARSRGRGRGTRGAWPRRRGAALTRGPCAVVTRPAARPVTRVSSWSGPRSARRARRRYLTGWNSAWSSKRTAPATGNGRSSSSTYEAGSPARPRELGLLAHASTSAASSGRCSSACGEVAVDAELAARARRRARCRPRSPRRRAARPRGRCSSRACA